MECRKVVYIIHCRVHLISTETARSIFTLKLFALFDHFFDLSLEGIWALGEGCMVRFLAFRSYPLIELYVFSYSASTLASEDNRVPAETK